LQDKLAQQQEKKKKMRGQKAPPKEAAVEDGSGEKKKKGKKGGAKEDQVDLEVVIEDLRGEVQWKDEEMKEMRDELEGLRAQVNRLHKDHKLEKNKRQSLESNKLKYQMMGELLECKGEIVNGTFFDSQRKEGQNTSESLKNQLVEQLKSNYKASLAMKYGMIWLNKVRENRQKKERANFFKY
jgi:hypothetical protein